MSQPQDSRPDGAEELFARARSGDQAAWQQLFRTCHPKLLRAVRRKLDPPMRTLYDSNDFASDVWKSLAAKFNQFDFPTLDSLIAFLTKAAERKVIDEYRRHHTLKRDMDRECSLDVAGADGAEPKATDPTASQVVVGKERYEQLLARLTPPEREVVQLKYQGNSVEEIAERTGWHVRKIQRLLKTVSAWLEAQGGRP